jgi:hypothetical protein
MNTKRKETGMVSLSTFASVCRQFNVSFAVEFTPRASYAVVDGNMTDWRSNDWRASPWYNELLVRGAVRDETCGDGEHELWFQLESLT